VFCIRWDSKILYQNCRCEYRMSLRFTTSPSRSPLFDEPEELQRAPVDITDVANRRWFTRDLLCHPCRRPSKSAPVALLKRGWGSREMKDSSARPQKTSSSVWSISKECSPTLLESWRDFRVPAFPVNDEANRRVFWIGDLRACWCMSTIANLVIERYETENRIIQQSRRRR